MGTAIVYYSMSGNTALIASKLAEKLSAEPKPENDQMTEAFAKKMMGVRCHDL